MKEFLPDESRLDNLNYQKEFIQKLVRNSTEKEVAKIVGVKRNTVNDWKFGRTRIDFGSFRKLHEVFRVDIPNNLKFQTNKRNELDISNLKVCPELLWLIGVRLGDRNEDDYSIGLGSSDKEMILEFVDCLQSLFKTPKESLWYEIRIPPKLSIKASGVRKEFSDFVGIREDKIKVRCSEYTAKYTQPHFIVKHFNTVSKKLFHNMENNLDKLIENCDAKSAGAFVKGLIDSEGGVKESGRIVIAMRPKSKEILLKASEILNSFKIRNNFVDDKKSNLVRLTIYPDAKILEFCNPVCFRKSQRLSTALGRRQGFPDNVNRSGVSRS